MRKNNRRYGGFITTPRGNCTGNLPVRRTKPGPTSFSSSGLVRQLRESALRAGVALSVNHVCGMFGFFFTCERSVDTFSKVMACDVKRFAQFFHAMLDAGVYLAPSAFEAGFLSAAHTDADIESTIAIADEAFSVVRKQRR